MSLITTYDGEQQRILLEKGADFGWSRVQSMIDGYYPEARRLMLQRALGIGLGQYGDASFHKTSAELFKESMEEIADLYTYQTIDGLRSMGYIK